MGQKTFTGKMAISQKDYSELTALAKEGITSRAEIKNLSRVQILPTEVYGQCKRIGENEN